MIEKESFTEGERVEVGVWKTDRPTQRRYWEGWYWGTVVELKEMNAVPLMGGTRFTVYRVQPDPRSKGAIKGMPNGYAPENLRRLTVLEQLADAAR